MRSSAGCRRRLESASGVLRAWLYSPGEKIIAVWTGWARLIQFPRHCLTAFWMSSFIDDLSVAVGEVCDVVYDGAVALKITGAAHDDVDGDGKIAKAFANGEGLGARFCLIVADDQKIDVALVDSLGGCVAAEQDHPARVKLIGDTVDHLAR